MRIIDDETLIIPDRPGNNRADTMLNILANPKIGLLFMIPGIDDTVRVNGKVTDHFRTNNMVHGVAKFISRMSQYLTLYPGDVVWTGTEGAPANLKHGDVCEIEITGIGILRNPLVRAAA